MTDIKSLLERQARWQKARKDLTWPEKVRMAEQIRSSAAQWRMRKRDTAESSTRGNSSRGAR
jgi:hypothetical protein